MAISLAKAIITCKCPRCRKGNMFTFPFYDIAHFRKMNKNCPICQLHFEIEPGFFWGAMYISYALNVVECFSLGFLLFFVFKDPANEVYFSVIISGIFVFLPFNYKLSRSLMLHLFSSVQYSDL